MNIPAKRFLITMAATIICMATLNINSAFSQQYKGLNGVESVKAVFDIRVKTPQALAVHLDLIHDTFEDPVVTALPGPNDFVVIFMGPAVKFISKQPVGYSTEDMVHLDAIAAMIPALAENGIKLQVCMFAANSHGIRPEFIFPKIEQVKNGWISSIGYQRQGYALVPDF